MNKINYLYSISVLIFCVISVSADELSTTGDMLDSSVSADELSTTGDMLDSIAAIVNEGIVLKSELNVHIEAITKRVRNQEMRLPPPNILQEQVLENLIMKQIQLQRAERIGIQISDQKLNEVIANVAEQQGHAFEDMPHLIAADGISYSTYRRDMREQVIMEQLKNIDVIGRISVAPSEIDQCLIDVEDNVVVNSEYNLSHILISVPDSATSNEFAEAETKANDVHKQIQDGANFPEMAMRYSDLPSGLEGGSLGWRKGDQLPTLFSDVVGSMKAGNVSNPIRAISGYHIVKVNDLRGTNPLSKVEQMKLRHILIKPNEIIDNETAKQQLEKAVVQIAAGKGFGEIAKLLSDDPGSVNEGGEMGWRSPNAFVPEFEAIANKAKIGVVSDPFQTRFGWHIIEVMDRRIYDNTEDLKENGCIQRIRNSKVSEEEQLWMRRMRDEAFVDIRI